MHLDAGLEHCHPVGDGLEPDRCRSFQFILLIEKGLGGETMGGWHGKGNQNILLALLLMRRSPQPHRRLKDMSFIRAIVTWIVLEVPQHGEWPGTNVNCTVQCMKYPSDEHLRLDGAYLTIKNRYKHSTTVSHPLAVRLGGTAEVQPDPA